MLQIKPVAFQWPNMAATKSMVDLDLKEKACLATFSALEKRGIAVIPET